MDEKPLAGMRVAILVTQYFEQVEYTEPKKALEEAGAIPMTLSDKPGSVEGMVHADKGDLFPVDRVLSDADPQDFDAVLLPGGALNADKLRVVPEAQEFVRKMDAAGKPIAVICHAPWLLVSAGVVRGRTMTSYHTIQDDLRNAGAIWVDREVVLDGNWISSRNPKDIPAFNREMVRVFSEHTPLRARQAGRNL